MQQIRLLTFLLACCPGALNAAEDITAADSYSFRKHVLPIFAKQGCNSGACHGALAGKGGFRLSLRGYDPETDYFNIVKQDRGRRTDFAQPARSLVLAKPSGAVAHKGGLRFETDSVEYRIISEWIAAGAPPPSAADPVVKSITVTPARETFAVGDTRQMTVTTDYSDGTSADVTRWVKWLSANEAVAAIDDVGLVTVMGAGEGAIVAWYDSKIAIARITVPFTNAADAEPDAEQTVDTRKPRNFLDQQIDAQLARLDLPASPACSDADFIRRASIDTLGVLPTAEEVRSFLADSAEDKRDKLIDELLARPEFVDYWTYKWSDLLMLNGNLIRPQALKTYYEWIHQRVEQNMPWDQFVREVLTATGSSHENGATNFYALHQAPEDMTENACQAFLGLSIGCAKCHNHPLEKWTNDQYYGMASLFARVRAKGWGRRRSQRRRSANGLRRRVR